ncbi:protein chibby homolog 1-like [Actinia tenebrosa]|uniref:Protein chibby homolog 1-like n=1 Tax=Actinia tenebrosa TaxID=6105 RepID=A0A6P8H758_ACTTE|nr:protein chibby homolog 1-like [Actinia tenebrosa]
MPLFGKRHKSPRRKLEAGASNTLKSSLGLPEHSGNPSDPNNPVKLTLGGNELVFQDGEWYSETNPGVGGKGSAEVNKLQKQNTQLKEENNYLKYKIDVLLDMLAATTADCNVIEKELETLQSQKRTRSMQR